MRDFFFRPYITSISPLVEAVFIDETTGLNPDLVSDIMTKPYLELKSEIKEHLKHIREQGETKFLQELDAIALLFSKLYRENSQVPKELENLDDTEFKSFETAVDKIVPEKAQIHDIAELALPSQDLASVVSHLGGSEQAISIANHELKNKEYNKLQHDVMREFLSVR
jgi:hypothetical protein